MADLSDFVGEYIFTLIPDCSEVHQTDATVVSFGLDNMVIFVHENPSDGYRSHVGDVVVAGLADCSKVHNRILPVNQYVICEFSDSCDEDILRIRSAKTGLLIFSHIPRYSRVFLFVIHFPINPLPSLKLVVISVRLIKSTSS